MATENTVGGLFEDWSPGRAELVKTDMGQNGYPAVNIKEAAQEAVEKLGIEDPKGPGYLIPLFAEDAPEPSDEYVVYRPERGQFIWYDTKTSHGTQRFTSCSKFQHHEIGYRLRFWLSMEKLDLDDSELPAESVQPTDQLSEADQAQFFDGLKHFIQSERTTQRETNWQAYQELGLKEAIRRQSVSGPFAFSTTGSNSTGNPSYIYQVLLDDDEEIDLRDDENLFEGNRCIVDTDADAFPIPVKVTSVDDPQIMFRPLWDEIEDTVAVDSVLQDDEIEIWLSHLLNPVPFERRMTAIKKVEQNPDKRELLTGQRAIGFTVNKHNSPDPAVELNDYQQKALVWADSADDLVCIHGPPGTGKTRTLTAYVEYAASRNESVLVTAHSNQAVDNLLVGDSSRGSPEEGTLHALAQKDNSQMSIARVGNNSRNDVVIDNYAHQSEHNADIVAATTSGAAQFDHNQFDIAVVDEATQASRPATAIALFCAKKLVLAGDHKQLPPYCANESMQEEDMHISLFEYLLNRYDEQSAVLLKKQYRMHDEIATFPNEAFYNGELETANRNRDWQIDDLNSLIGINITGEERRRERGHSFYNPAEAKAVARQVELLVQSGVDPHDIGVITAYSGQIGEIGSRVNQLDIENPYAVSIDTVDSFQGGEREAIIVSFVRSNVDGYSGFLEFPEEGPRRLNVALTRARKRLVLIGDWETLGRVAPHRSDEDSCAPLYAALADYIRSNDRMLSPD
ncbi:DEAD/DEAH box helicase [Haloarcula nitratireducens]|uniref:AAA family ATPase n=1 Tax=Haloarcula nitratireducens TaxID=2487749 RepID=A0AAW4PF61_9EURY|nr:AAA domain-containing protein [Halomicroarcula nitratireducens]MBX0296687.1 AAA family ATPase [Halomicroarcula nitratireducens]